MFSATVKLQLTFLCVLLMAGCSGFERDAMPGPPYGTPDDTSQYVNGDYRDTTYFYYNHTCEVYPTWYHYHAVTWFGYDWLERSDYISSPIPKPGSEKGLDLLYDDCPEEDAEGDSDGEQEG